MANQIYQIQISLDHSKPKIWRRILVNSGITLDSLHKIIQIAMGWDGSHMHQFQLEGFDYAPKHFELEGALDSSKFKIEKILLNEKDNMRYEYDFGDGWMHKIKLEKILAYDKSLKLPSCIAGKGNCPPEDCGGIWGYYNLLAIISDPKHEEYEDMLEWYGPFDPNHFDLDYVNQNL
jgi:hypothetical protein